MAARLLSPRPLSSLGIAGHGLWLACSVLALVLYLGMWIVNERTAESRELGAAYPRAELLLVVAFNLAFTVLMIAALVLIVLGLLPDHEPALYLTAVGLVLSLGAFTLLFLVVSQRRPQAVSDPAKLPATGGSSA